MIFNALDNGQVLIIGDIILDKYLTGSVKRISPEAPVPVIITEKEISALGGAANVAHNVALLKTNCTIVGLAGNDAGRKELEKLLDTHNIKHYLFDYEGGTTTKTRVMVARQQIARIDEEKAIPSDSPIIYEAVDKAVTIMKQMPVVVISDYGKGLISEEAAVTLIKNARKSRMITIVDPKGSNWRKYKGATIITPNISELSEVVGRKVANTDEDVAAVGEEIRQKYSLRYLVVTRSEKGITLISENGISHTPTQAQEVFDVSGAGDTVVATLAFALGRGMPIEDAVVMANAAAGIVVSKLGTAPITYAELMQTKTLGTALSREQAKILAEGAATKGQKIVFTNGCFDILHKGHVQYLKEASRLGDVLIVGLNSDESVKRLKGASRPINSQDDRAIVLSALNMVDVVVIFEEDTPEELIKLLEPDILVKGGDYKPEEIAGREYAGQTVVIDFIDGYSTTATIKKLKR